jgi:hypothetical protein
MKRIIDMSAPALSRLPRLLLAAIGLCLSGCDHGAVQTQDVPKGWEKIMPDAPLAVLADARAGMVPGAVADSRAATAFGPLIGLVDRWVLPDGWQVDKKDDSIRFATLRATLDPTTIVEVAVTVFPGDVGGELANLNRWRGQHGMAPIERPEADPSFRRLGRDGTAGYYARVAGSEQTLLAGGVKDPHDDRTWFARATVDHERVASLEPQFLQFLDHLLETLIAEDGVK